MTHHYDDHPDHTSSIRHWPFWRADSGIWATPSTQPKAAADFPSAQDGEYEREVFAVMLLDNQHRLLDYQELFFGTINAGTIHPREVVKAALNRNAAAVISGPQPSPPVWSSLRMPTKLLPPVSRICLRW